MIPCIQMIGVVNHYYLLCFNMISAEIEIMDNLDDDSEDLDDRYGPYAMTMVIF